MSKDDSMLASWGVHQGPLDARNTWVPYLHGLGQGVANLRGTQEGAHASSFAAL